MPSHSQLEESDLDLIVAGTRDAITMIEGFAREMTEESMVGAILFAHKHIVQIIEMIEELRDKAGLGVKELPPATTPNPAFDAMKAKYYDEFRTKKQTTGKHARADAIKELREKIFADLLPENGEPKFAPEQVAAAFYALEERIIRDLILEGKRID